MQKWLPFDLAMETDFLLFFDKAKPQYNAGRSSIFHGYTLDEILDLTSKYARVLLRKII